jgi:hypothetical protein
LPSGSATKPTRSPQGMSAASRRTAVPAVLRPSIVASTSPTYTSGTRTRLDPREYPWRLLGRYRELGRISPQTDVAGGPVAAREPHIFLEAELAVEVGYTLDSSGVDHRERAQGRRVQGYPRTVARELLASGALSACALLCPNGREE